MDTDRREAPPLHPLKLGVLLDGRIQESWVLESLRRSLAVPGVRLATVAVVARGNSRKSFAGHLHRVLDRLDGSQSCDLVSDVAQPAVSRVISSARARPSSSSSCPAAASIRARTSST